MNDFKPLGKPIRKPPPAVEAVEPEMVRPGVYKSDGKVWTWIPDNERANSPPPDDDGCCIFTTKRWDEMTKALSGQEDDGFPLNEFGVL